MSLAAYDIELLKAWHTYNIAEQGKLHMHKSLLVAYASAQMACNSLL